RSRGPPSCRVSGTLPSARRASGGARSAVEAVSVTVPYAQVVGWIEGFGSTMAENKEGITQLDAPRGGADHGINMDRGMQAALGKLEGFEGDDVGGLLK